MFFSRMVRRLNSVKISLCVIVILCIILIHAIEQIPLYSFSLATLTKFERTNKSINAQHQRNHQNNFSSSNINNSSAVDTVNLHSAKYNHNTEQRLQNKSDTKNTATIEDILDAQRQKIALKMKNFNYTDQMTKLSALTPETNGQPIQSVILSTWRSGSTFFGGILNAVSNTYYYYEPLTYYQNHQIRCPPDSLDAINTIRQLLKCNYTGLDDYLKFTERDDFQWFIRSNKRLWKICKPHGKCWDPNFLNSFCRLFPFQSMKLVRLHPALSELLLMDPELNVKIVLLIRDPRGIIQSRKHESHWCNHPDCNNAEVLCKDLVSDFKATKYLSNKYPSRFKVIRYEDLSLNPFNMTEDIFDFYGLPFDANVEQFLDEHTQTDSDDAYSTYRNSRTAPFQWIHKSTWKDIEQIQKVCTEAILLWGYKLADNEDAFNRTSFNPLLELPLVNNTALSQNVQQNNK